MGEDIVQLAGDPQPFVGDAPLRLLLAGGLGLAGARLGGLDRGPLAPHGHADRRGHSGEREQRERLVAEDPLDGGHGTGEHHRR